MKFKSTTCIKSIVVFLCLFLTSSQLYSQRILGYYPYYRPGTYNTIEFDKATDIVYAFLNADSNGNLVYSGTFDSADFNAMVVAARSQNPNIKIHISSGGWNLSNWFVGVVNNPTARQNFITQMADFIVNNNLDGWDLDWEFPYTQTDRDAHELLLQSMRAELDVRGQALCKHFDISMAVGGDASASGHVNYYNPIVIDYVDFVSLMAYDDGGSQNHSSYAFGQNAINGYNATLGWSKSKMMLGIPFYGRGANGGAAETYAGIAASNPAMFYNQDDNGTYYYNGMPMLESKIDLIMSEGGQGVTIWELAQDRMGQTYSLLDGLNTYMQANYGSPPADALPCCYAPDLGADISACGMSFPMTLNSQTPTNTDVVFTWKEMPSTTLVSNSLTATTLSINNAGTYVVIRDSTGCSQTDTIVISTDLPTPVLPNTMHLCSPSSVDLVTTNIADYPIGTTWEWKKDNVLITGKTNSSLTDVREAGMYSVEASFAGCGIAMAMVDVTSDLATPVDACNNTTGTLDLSLNNAGAGPYTWYDSPISTTALGTGTNYTTPSISTTTTYYVADESSFATTAGTPTTGNGFTGVNDWISPTIMTFDALQSFTLKGLTLRALIWSGTHDVSIEIRDNGGVLVNNGNQTFSLTAIGAAPAWQTVSLSGGGVYLTAGTYTITVTSAVGIGHWTNVTYPVSDSYMSMTSSSVAGSTLAIHDWQIEGGNVCDRLAVVAKIGDCAAPLPVELLNFEAKKINETTHLSWQTVSEINTKFFEIERLDNHDFKAIGQVDANGFLNAIQSYNFIDEAPKNGENYYRLKIMDVDGSVNYSEIQSIHFSTKNEVAIYPNPTTNVLNISINTVKDSRIMIVVRDVLGQIIYQEKINASSGEFIHSMDVEHWVNGWYIVEMNGENWQLQQQFLKIK